MNPEELPEDPSLNPEFEQPNRRVVGKLIEDEPEDTEPEVTELSAQERKDFSSLLTCGKRSKKITVMGHPVVIQTLKTSDEMRIGLYVKKYLDSQLGQQRSYQVAVCAAGIRDVQGQPLLKPDLREITDEDEIFDKKVEAVKEFYPIVVTQIYDAIMSLEREFAELALKLGKL